MRFPHVSRSNFWGSNLMNKRNKALLVWATVTFLTLLLYVFGSMDVYPRRALPLIWVFFSWNFVAFGFDRGMWPRTFVELDGYGKGHPLAREVVFWGTAVLYLLLLATIAWAE